ncbi:hypothetical protein GCM10020254_77590 [Streptomyces goshikiensis]
MPSAPPPSCSPCSCSSSGATPDPLLPLGIFSQGTVGPANLVMTLLGSVWVGLFFFLPLYQQQVLGAGPLEAGLAQLPLAAANMIGSSLAPALTRRVGAYRTLVAGLLIQAAGLLWLARISADGTFLTDVLGPILLIGLGLGMAFVQLTGAAVSGVRTADAGLASGLVNTTRQIGGSVGLAVLGTLAAARTAGATALPHTAALTEGYRTVFLASAAVLAAAAALSRLLVRGAPRPERDTAGSDPPAALPHRPRQVPLITPQKERPIMNEPYLTGHYAPRRRRDHRHRPHRRGHPAARADRPAPAQQPQPEARHHPHPLVQGQRHGPRDPAPGGPRRVVPQPLGPHPRPRRRPVHDGEGARSDRQHRRHPRHRARRPAARPQRGRPAVRADGRSGDRGGRTTSTGS